MKILIGILTIVAFLGVSQLAAAKAYSTTLCGKPNYICIKVKRGQNWDDLVSDSEGQELLKRINRINTDLYPGMTIAIPTNLNELDLLKVAPFPHQREPLGRTTIIIDLSDQAFGAYNAMGTLIHWGPVSAGKGYCPDVGRGCHTPTGVYYIISKGGPDCISTKYPIPEGGAPMPYCMFFHGGYALHGSILPGYNASHGCVRLFDEDAEWLNHEFVELGKNRTKVIVQP